MLVKYKKSLEKIAMGLLSYMPLEKDVKRLMETIQQYDQNDNWNLYLWKKDDEYIGTVGIVVDDAVATVQHLTVVPSYRGEGIGHKMIEQLSAMGQYDVIQSNGETESFLKCCKEILEQAGN